MLPDALQLLAPLVKVCKRLLKKFIFYCSNVVSRSSLGEKSIYVSIMLCYVLGITNNSQQLFIGNVLTLHMGFA